MYCRYCGKQIEDDSLYCKFCGRNIGLDEVKHDYKFESRFIECIRYFKSQPISTQIWIAIYVVYLLLWICAIVEDSDEDVIIGFIIYAFVIPFALVSIYYFWTVYKRHKQTTFKKAPRETKEESDCVGEVKEDESPNPTLDTDSEVLEDKRFVSKMPLMEFAEAHGKMRLIERTNSKGDVVRYCLFEKSEGDGTIVLFPEDKEDLSAGEIAKDKYILWVKECSDGTFYLDYY